MSGTFEELFSKLFKHNINSNVYTSIPAEVIKVETFTSEQTVDVKPLINKTYDDGVVLALPSILSVPVVFPSAGGGVLTFPIKKGDTVLIVFSMRSIDEWLEGKGESVTPSDIRTHYLNDAIAIPGLYTKKSHLNPNKDDVELKFINNGEVTSAIRMTPSGELVAKSKGNVTATSEQGDVILSNGQNKSLTLKQSGEVRHHSGARITDGGNFITASGKSLDNHTHNVPVTSGSSQGVYESGSPT